jgi:WD40 repeat protein
MWSVAANDNVVVANPGELDYESSNGTFTGFDTTTGQQLWAVNATSNYFTDVVMDSATGYVMSASTSGFTQTLYVWDGANGDVIGTMGTSIGGNRAFARDGAVAYVALSNDDGAGFGIDAIYFGNGTNAPLRTA